jgi:hypothetical protein
VPLLLHIVIALSLQISVIASVSYHFFDIMYQGFTSSILFIKELEGDQTFFS